MTLQMPATLSVAPCRAKDPATCPYHAAVQKLTDAVERQDASAYLSALEDARANERIEQAWVAIDADELQGRKPGKKFYTEADVQVAATAMLLQEVRKKDERLEELNADDPLRPYFEGEKEALQVMVAEIQRQHPVLSDPGRSLLALPMTKKKVAQTYKQTLEKAIDIAERRLGKQTENVTDGYYVDYTGKEQYAKFRFEPSPTEHDPERFRVAVEYTTMDRHPVTGELRETSHGSYHDFLTPEDFSVWDRAPENVAEFLKTRYNPASTEHHRRNGYQNAVGSVRHETWRAK